MNKEDILNVFKFRHACKEFDSDKKINDEDFNFILETARLKVFKGRKLKKFLFNHVAWIMRNMVFLTWLLLVIEYIHQNQKRDKGQRISSVGYKIKTNLKS